MQYLSKTQRAFLAEVRHADAEAQVQVQAAQVQVSMVSGVSSNINNVNSPVVSYFFN